GAELPGSGTVPRFPGERPGLAGAPFRVVRDGPGAAGGPATRRGVDRGFSLGRASLFALPAKPRHTSVWAKTSDRGIPRDPETLPRRSANGGNTGGGIEGPRLPVPVRTLGHSQVKE